MLRLIMFRVFSSIPSLSDSIYWFHVVSFSFPIVNRRATTIRKRRTIINGLFLSPIVYETHTYIHTNLHLYFSLSPSFLCCISENLASHGAGHFSNKYEIQYPCHPWRANVASASATAVERIDIDAYCTSRSRSTRPDDRQIATMYHFS